MKFVLNGCDIEFIAEAPDDITLKQLIEQLDKLVPDYCACGICSLNYKNYDESNPSEIEIGYDSIKIVQKHVPCKIKEFSKIRII